MAKTIPSEEELREVARNRGLRLVKSRKRTPGSGDFGKFGLKGADGKPVFGHGDDGLTADAEDIEGYLRSGVASTWRTSAKTAKANSKSAAPKAKSPGRTPERPARKARQDPPPAPPARAEPKRPKAPAPLAIRAAAKKDAAAIGALLSRISEGGGNTAEIERHFEAMAGSKSGVIVAEQDEVEGIVAWSIFPTLQQGWVGRITLLFVAEAVRRRGLGRKLLGAVEEAVAKAGCATLEAMSDIEIRNAHGFFRSTGFEQTSYRFGKSIRVNR